MAMTPDRCLWRSQIVINDPATVTGDRLMIVPLGQLDQIGWVAARFLLQLGHETHRSTAVSVGKVNHVWDTASLQCIF